MPTPELIHLLHDLCSQSQEQPFGYLAWGVENDTKSIFRSHSTYYRKKNFRSKYI